MIRSSSLLYLSYYSHPRRKLDAGRGMDHAPAFARNVIAQVAMRRPAVKGNSRNFFCDRCYVYQRYCFPGERAISMRESNARRNTSCAREDDCLRGAFPIIFFDSVAYFYTFHSLSIYNSALSLFFLRTWQIFTFALVIDISFIPALIPFGFACYTTASSRVTCSLYFRMIL